MTEIEWLACFDLKRMLDYLYLKRSSNRKLRLFGVACCRRLRSPAVLDDDVLQRGIVTAELFADQQIGDEEAQEACQELLEEHTGELLEDCRLARWAVADMLYLDGPDVFDIPFVREAGAYPINVSPAAGLARDAVRSGTRSPWWRAWWNGPAAVSREQKAQCALLRDNFGNPFRTVAFDPVWHTDNVTAVAQMIYDERRFGHMPILADALEEAGCTSRDVLDHCRAPAEHSRGCWVVDLVLKKS